MISALDCAYNRWRYLEAKRKIRMNTYPDIDHRRECWVGGGWNLADDDCPRVPECDEPMASGQRKRWLKSRNTPPAIAGERHSH
jgi:hypothetical protein